MPLYASRVAVTVPVTATLGSGDVIVVGHRCEERMFDKIKASSIANANTKVKRESKRYWRAQWNGDIEQSIPPPRIIATCRLDDAGVPVLADFPLPATAARVTAMPTTTEDKGKKRPRNNFTSTKTKTIETPPAVTVKTVFNLSDPFTAELIDAVSVKTKGVKEL